MDKAQRKVAVRTAVVRYEAWGGDSCLRRGGGVNVSNEVSNLQNIYKFYTKRAKKKNCQAS
jgi:hypothetical protein